MKVFFLLLLLKITLCEYDKRVITTLKYSRYHVVPTIVNGYPSVRGQMPYLVSIKEPATAHGYARNILWLPLCGASIISKRDVLTAAHCFEGKRFFYFKRPDLLRLVAGNVDSNHYHSGETETTDRGQWRQVAKVYLHQHFSFPENDIALVKVDEPWNFTNYVNYAVPATIKSDYPSSCFTAGFGRTRHDSGSTSLTPILLEARIDVIPVWQCTALWELDMSKFVCTDSAVADVGAGDSGGPLGCRFTLDPAEQPGRDLLVGVVSGKNFDKTSLFTRVSKYKSWMDDPTSCACRDCAVMCPHCQAPVSRHERFTVLEGCSYHDKCTKCYVCSVTDLLDAEVFKGVIFCSSCSDRIFRGCSTAKNSKNTARKTRVKSHKRRSHRSKSRTRRQAHGILELTKQLGGGGCDSSIRSVCASTVTNDRRNSKSLIPVSAEMALTITKPIYDGLFQMASTKKLSAEIGVTTEVTQQLLNELNCPVITRHSEKSCSIKLPSQHHATKQPPNKRSGCSDLRVAELGTSREMANMALRHRNEMPVIIKSVSRLRPETTTSESLQNKGSADSGDPRDDGWLDSAYSTMEGSNRSTHLGRIGSLLKTPFSAFQRKIIRRSSVINTLMNDKDSMAMLKKIRAVFQADCNVHQKSGLKKLFSTINHNQVPNKLGWLNLVSKVYMNHSNTMPRFSNNSYEKRCKHFSTSHSYRCMRAQAMQLAGPTKSELAVIRKKIKHAIAPGFVRHVGVAYYRRPAIVVSQACGASNADSTNGGKLL